jgi:hypothetical protein
MPERHFSRDINLRAHRNLDQAPGSPVSRESSSAFAGIQASGLSQPGIRVGGAADVASPQRGLGWRVTIDDARTRFGLLARHAMAEHQRARQLARDESTVGNANKAHGFPVEAFDRFTRRHGRGNYCRKGSFARRSRLVAFSLSLCVVGGPESNEEAFTTRTGGTGGRIRIGRGNLLVRRV